MSNIIPGYGNDQKGIGNADLDDFLNKQTAHEKERASLLSDYRNLVATHDPDWVPTKADVSFYYRYPNWIPTPEDDGVRMVSFVNKLNGLIGEKGARKSSLLWTMAKSIYTDDPGLTLGYRSNLNPEDTVLFFDTESFENDIRLFQKRFHDDLGTLAPSKTNFMVFPLEEFTEVEQQVAIHNTVMQLMEEGKKISWIAIDQVMDLVVGRDENDKREGNRVLGLMQGLRRLTSCDMTYLMHTNRGGYHSDGSVGKNWDKKTAMQQLCRLARMKGSGIPNKNQTVVMMKEARNCKPYEPFVISNKITGGLELRGLKEEMEDAVDLGKIL